MPMFQLGDPVNVLSGLGSVAGEVAPPPGPRPLIAISRAQPPSLRPFAPLAVTLHESLGGLLTALFDVRVDVSREHLGQRRLDAAALIAPDPAFLARIGAPAAGYLLFTLDRDDGEVVHDVASIGIDDRVHMADYWTEAGKRAMARLRSTATRLDADGVWRPFVRQAQMARYLDYFYHHGTHFISRIGYGQRLWQVFALRAERMAFLVDHFRRVVPGGRAEGALAASFAQFCGPEWCDRRSEILALTPEDTLPGLVAAGAFKGVGDADVLAAPFLEAEWRAARLLDGFGAGGPLRLHLMSQAYLMGEGRARVWQKVLNVALVQRYGAGTAAVSQGEPAMSPALATGAATGGLADRLRLRGGAAVAVPAGLRELWVGDIAVEPFGAPAVVCHAPEGLTLHAGEIDGIVAVEESPSRRVTYGWGLKMGRDPRTGRVIALDDPRRPTAPQLAGGVQRLTGLLLHGATLLALGGAERARGQGLVAWIGEMVGAASSVPPSVPPEAAAAAGDPWTKLAEGAAALGGAPPGALDLAKNRHGAAALLALVPRVGMAELRLHCEGVTPQLDEDIDALAKALATAVAAVDGQETPLFPGLATSGEAATRLWLLSLGLAFPLARLLRPSADAEGATCGPGLSDLATALWAQERQDRASPAPALQSPHAVSSP